jgi:hypothetical protein
MNQYFKYLLLAFAALLSVDAFSPSAAFTSLRQQNSFASSLTPMSMAVVDIDGETAFDNTIKNAGDSLVVVDYSTTW